MEVAGIVLSVAQTLFAALQSSELKKFVSVFGYEHELEKLQDTVSTIQAVFQDAERKETLSAVKRKLLEDLKDAVYEADDLIDEFVTLAEQKQQLDADGNLSAKLRHFFTPSKNHLTVACRMSKGVKKIRKKLDAIVDNNRFSFVHDPEPIMKRRPETCSYVNEVDIIGRDQDLENILGMLFDPDVVQNLSFLSIVGIGGMGKTALAQLVFNHPKVTTAFSLKLWTCVSDQDQKQLDVREVLGKILASATNQKGDEALSLDSIQSNLQQQFASKRYLIILDDVWTEKREDWRGLKQYFVGGLRGSWIVVTTRSKQTATIIGDGPMYMLQGLSVEDSRHLFQTSAFGPNESNPPNDQVNLGREIVDGCAGVPLAIRVMGSFLYGQDMSKWQLVKKIGFSNILRQDDGIMPILQLSYHHLEPPLKSCFRYCALFPKDYVMCKETLINLWIAQGYVVPFYEGQSVEDAGEEYFSILLKRCFFQDIKEYEPGEILSCKIHDLIHDIAQSTSEKEIWASNNSYENVNEKVRHFSIPINEYCKHSLDMLTHIRSYIIVGSCYMYNKKVEYSFLKALISSCRGLRAFCLDGLEMKTLPDSISTLLHLRYLDLSYNRDLEVVPNSISKLYNLEILKLNSCENLKELPKDLSMLVKLRVLDISYYKNLKYMPRDMDKMTSLHELRDFIVGSERSFVSWKQWFDGLVDLKTPNNLKGELGVTIKLPIRIYNVVIEADKVKGSILRNMEQLNSISIHFENETGGEILEDEGIMAMMEVLQPHSNIKDLGITFDGTRMPDWASSYHLLNLVELHLYECKKLKGWRRGADDGSNNNKSSCLPLLKLLSIIDCPHLTWIPLCPNIETLRLQKFNGRMVFGEIGSASTSCDELTKSCHKIKKIEIDNMAWLNSQPKESFQCLQHLNIYWDYKVEKLGAIKEVFRSCSSSLQKLEIRWCHKLKSVVGGGLEHLTALEELEFCDCENMSLSEEEKEGEDGGEYSLSLLPSLHTLTLKELTELKNMPNWVSKLTSLRNLHVSGYLKSLKRRCQEDPQGEDWPLIQHIPNINFESWYFSDIDIDSVEDIDAEEDSDRE